MTTADAYRNAIAEAAIQAVSGAITDAGAQARLQHVLGPLMPALRRAAAKEHAAEIKSFVNADRIDFEIEVVTAAGTVISSSELTKQR